MVTCSITRQVVSSHSITYEDADVTAILQSRFREIAEIRATCILAATSYAADRNV
jgi:hypothetical protein